MEKYKNQAIIGHFGLGFYSAIKDAKKVEIITKSYRDAAKAVKWTCDGSPEFTIDEIENALIMDGELSKKADAIIDKIYSNGAGDNISLILVNKL